MHSLDAMTRWLALAIALAGVTGACASSDRRDLIPHQTSNITQKDPGTPQTVTPPTIPASVGATLKGPTAAHEDLCTNDGMHPNFPNDADAITRTFCQDLVPNGVMPTPKGLGDLLAQLGLAFVDRNGGNGTARIIAAIERSMDQVAAGKRVDGDAVIARLLARG